ncbi:hypothetical protein SDJN02_24970, partial [Cucurbita argyrosperma subsp. argyrosperma]
MSAGMRKKKNPWETDSYLNNMIMDVDAAMSNQQLSVDAASFLFAAAASIVFLPFVLPLPPPS